MLGPSIAAEAAQPVPSAPVPIPYGLDIGGGQIIHVLAPTVFGPETDNPITITDFDGRIGYAIIDGVGVGTGPAGSKSYTFNVDMRFMTGVYRGADGRTQAGTFGFIWLDVYDGPVGSNQIRDYNPGIAPSGLFWTIPVPQQAVEVDLDAATARYQLTDAAVPDYGSFENAVGGGAPTPAVVSFDVRWHHAKKRLSFRNDAQGFAGRFVQTDATISWSSRQSGFSFVSTGVTQVDGAEIGAEMSGVFLPPGRKH